MTPTVQPVTLQYDQPHGNRLVQALLVYLHPVENTIAHTKLLQMVMAGWKGKRTRTSSVPMLNTVGWRVELMQSLG